MNVAALQEQIHILHENLPNYCRCFPNLASTQSVLHKLILEDIQQAALKLVDLLWFYREILTWPQYDLKRRELLALLSDTAAVLSVERDSRAYVQVSSLIQSLL